jgi:hypothetical protein
LFGHGWTGCSLAIEEVFKSVTTMIYQCKLEINSEEVNAQLLSFPIVFEVGLLGVSNG